MYKSLKTDSLVPSTHSLLTPSMAATHPWMGKWPEHLDFSNQSVQVPDTQRPGQTSKNRLLSRPTRSRTDVVFWLKVPTEAVRQFPLIRVQTLNLS